MSASVAVARLKRAVRAAIEACGNIDGTAATVERGRSIVGDWHNINHRAFPPLDCAFAMDEVAVARGLRPEVLHRLAAELGHVVFQLPAMGAGTDAETGALMEAMQEFGDVAAALRDMLADGVREQHERDRVVREIDEAQSRLVRLRAIVAGPIRAVHEDEQAAR